MTSFFGANVGKAYIEILADGNRFPESVREEFNDPKIDKETRRAGERRGEAYEEGITAGRERGFKRGSKDDKDFLSSKNIVRGLKQDKGVYRSVETFFEKEGERINRAIRDGLKTGDKDLDRDLDVITKRAVNRLKDRALQSRQALRSVEQMFRTPKREKLVQAPEEEDADFRRRQQAADDAYNAQIREQAARRRAFFQSERARYEKDEDRFHSEALAEYERFERDRRDAQVESLHRRLRDFRAAQDEERRLDIAGQRRLASEEEEARRRSIHDQLRDSLRGNTSLLRQRRIFQNERDNLDQRDFEGRRHYEDAINKLEDEMHRRRAAANRRFAQEDRAEQDREGRLLTKRLQKQLSDRAALYDHITSRRLKTRITRELRGDQGDLTILERGQRIMEDIRRGNFAEAEKFERELRKLNGLLHGGREVKSPLRPFLRDLSNGERRLKRFDDDVDKIGHSIGRLFGKGGRNNFLNAFGALVGGLTTGALNAPIKLARGFLTLKHDIRAAAREGNGFFSSFGRVAELLSGKLALGLGGAIAGIGGLFGLLNVLQLVLGPVASLISGLGAGIVALASSISFGLVASLISAGPLLIGLAATVGIVASAFAGLKKDKGLKAQIHKELAPVTKEFRELQAVTRKGLFSNLHGQSGQLKTLLHTLKPLFGGVGKSVSGVVTHLLRSLNSPSAKQFFKSFDHFLNGAGGKTGAIAKLGTVMSNWLRTAFVYLRLALPYATKFLDSMVASSRRGRKLAESFGGQNKIRKFFREAEESGHKLFTSIRLVGRVLRDLFGGGRKAGNGLFDSMNNGLTRFDNYLRSSKGRKALDGWFAQVGPLFHAIGQLFKGFGRLFDKLDSPQSRATLNGLLTGIGNVLGFIGDLMPEIQNFQKEVSTAFGNIAKVIGPLASLALEGLSNAIHLISISIGPLLDGLAWMLNHLGPLHPLIVGLATAVGLLFLSFSGVAKITAATTAIRNFGIVSTATGIARSLSSITYAVTNGIGPLLTAKEKLGTALAGISVLLAGNVAGNAVGGDLGHGISIGSGIAGGALAGSVFGPEGAAAGAVIGGVTSAIMDGVRAWGRHKQAAADALKLELAQIDALTTAIEADNGALGNNLRIQVTKMLQDKGLLDQARQLGLNVGDVVSAAMGEKNGIGKTLNTQFASAQATLKRLGFQGITSIKDLNAALAAASEAGVPVSAADAAAATAAEKQLLALSALRAGLKAMGIDIGKAKDNADLFAAGMNDSRTATGHFASQLGALKSGTSVAVDNMGQLNTSLTLNTVIGRHNSQTLIDLARAAKNDAVAQASRLVATKGVNGALSAANGTLGTHLKQLRAAALAAGFNAGEVDKMIGAIGKVRPVNLNPASTVAQINSIQDHIDRIRQNKVPGLRADSAAARAEIQRLQDKIDNLKGKVVDLLANVDVNVNVSGAGVRSQKSGITFSLASGGIVDRPTWLRSNVLTGEAGREAVVPLERPLSQIDPSVRYLAAIAQGKVPNNGSPAGKFMSTTPGRTVNIHPGAIQVVTPTTDPRAVAAETVNRIAAGVLLG